MNFSSIRVKIFVLTIIILLPLITLQGFRIKTSFDDNIQRELKSSEDIADAISTSFLNHIEELWSQEQALSVHFSMDENLSLEEIQAYLEKVATTQETTSGYTWVNPEGVAIASSTKEIIGVSLKKREFIQRILAGEDKVVSDLENSYGQNQPIVPVAMAVRKDGQLKGIIVALIDVHKIFQRLPRLKSNNDERYGFIDRRGMLVYRSDNNDIPYEKRLMTEDAPAWKALKGEVVITKKKISSVDWTTRMGVDYPIKEIGWECFVTSSYDKVMAKYYEDTKRDVIILSIVSIISIILSIVLGDIIAKKIIILKETASIIMKGDYSARIEVKGNDELAATGYAFNLMAEELERTDKLKNQFFTNISHELKTPLNVIFDSAQLLGSTPDNMNYNELHRRVKKNAKMIRQNCYRLLRLISNIIDITRFDSGFIKPNLGNHDIVRVVEDITLSVVRYAESKEITIVFDTEIEEKKIAFDPDMLERVILNLISNAIKFTDKNGYIYVNMYHRNENIIISVRDTGIGIPEDKTSLIFERFGQVDTSLSRNCEGSGIGLSLVKSIIEAHNGFVTVKSISGEGTEFNINIPVNLLSEESNTENSAVNKYTNSDRIVERINIEFSDIYSINEFEP